MSREFNRWWCRACEEWTLFHKGWNEKNGQVCQTCGSEMQPFELDDVPEDKIEEQRKRWTRSQGAALASVLESFYRYGAWNPLADMFKETKRSDETIEHPAGQDVINEKEAEKRDAEKKKRQVEDQEKRLATQAEKKKFSDLGRNELCLCGSGLKYKKCCWTRIQKME